MDVLVINMRVRLNIYKASSQPVFEDESECFFIDVIDELIKEASPAILNKYPLGTYLFHGDLKLFDLGSTTGELDSNLNSTSHLESSSWISNDEPLSPLTIFLYHLLFSPYLNLS